MELFGFSSTRQRHLCVVLLVCVTSMLSVTTQAKKDPLQEIRDLEYGNALFYFYQDKFFDALVQLSAAQTTGKIEFHSDEARLLVGGLYLSYGMHHIAGEIFDDLIDQYTAPATRDQAWFYLAKFRYQRGLDRAAVQALEKIENKLPKALEPESQFMYANLLMRAGQYPQAAEKFGQIKKRSSWSIYGRYNQGISWIRAGETERGVETLSKLGQIESSQAELKTLRDKANLALGYSFLQDKKPEQVETYLNRVRLKGQYSNKALLGLGWARAQQGNIEQALTPWLELQERNLLDPAVQESKLAVPYALEQLGAIQQSMEFYQKAIQSYLGQMQHLDDAIEDAKSGDMLKQLLDQNPEQSMGWFWRLDELPDTPSSQYLHYLWASHGFQEGLKNFRDLQFLQQNLERWGRDMVVFEHMLETRRLAYEERIPKIDAAQRHVQERQFRETTASLKQQLVQIEHNKDALALANEDEFDQLLLIKSVEQRIERLSAQTDLTEERDKLRLLRGILYWQISADYAPRIWANKKLLQELEDTLTQNDRVAASLQQARDNAPKGFDGYHDRISGYRTQIETLLEDTETLLAQQGQFLRNLAADELKQQKKHLTLYLAQAQFALAQQHDRALHGKRVEP